VPAYQALASLPAVLGRIERAVDAVIVVDDGSTDGSVEFLRSWSEADAPVASGKSDHAGSRMERGAHDARAERTRIAILRERNGGKAAALRDGFDAALARGFELAVTVDADGQHDPEDARRLASMARELAAGEHGAASVLLCGVRDAGTPGYPLRNLAGRRLNDLAIRAQTGVSVEDSPCGLRVYPLSIVRRVRCLSGRFAWEEEFITRAIWAGASYRAAPIRCIYETGPERRSHYRFRRDWPEGIAINLWLCARALFPPAPTRRSLGRFAWQVGAGLSPGRAIDQLLGDSPSRLHGAATMAIGAASFGRLGVAEWSELAVGTVAASGTGGYGARGAWIAVAIGAWIVLRLHGSLPLALAAGAGAALLARLPVSPAITAIAILAVLSNAALRRRAP